MPATLQACLVLVLLCPVAEGAAAVEESRTTYPNILLVVSDDHSAPHVGCYGNPDVRTPVLDRLSQHGILCRRAYVTAPQCVPSRASILTGRMPLEIGLCRFSDNLRREVKILPEYLSQVGYFTGLCGRAYHLDGSGDANRPAIRALLTQDELPNIKERVDFCRVAGHPNLGEQALKQMQEFLDQKPADRPFFLQLCWSDPHRGWDDAPKPDPIDPRQLTLPETYPDTPGVRKDLAEYYNEINRLDAHTGRALEVLRERELYDNTIVVFIGDNGGSQFRGKGTLNELGIWVPLIIRLPHDEHAGTELTPLVSAEDLVPTLLEAIGLSIPSEITGKSFYPGLAGRDYEAREYVFAERMGHTAALPVNSSAFDLGRAVVSERFKRIYNCIWQLPYTPVDFDHAPFFNHLKKRNGAGELSELHSRLYFSDRAMFELYDLAEDPLELNNLAGSAEAREVENRLRTVLSAQMMRAHDFLPPPIPGKKGW
ncbi:Arylsulfatase [Pirellulimonas nuda]|uniref:Arylsulfatase n=1 Tax=Pirellulimonas nuda TaxID=2528009 RepID=A0A518DH83_9BACT|nr:sulfatase [Pirellulimonas nuda]QDU90802.1 Arylsulfatase [Pirellulimonas nuda]